MRETDPFRKNLNDENSYYSAHALICGSAYKDGNLSQLIIAQVLIISTMLLCLFWIQKFAKRINNFPVKERAPKLALLQSFCFFSIILIPYITEYFIDFWDEVVEASEIPFSRKMMKSLYFTLRLSCYMMFVPRYKSKLTKEC